MHWMELFSDYTLNSVAMKYQTKKQNDINLATDRTFFMDLFTDDMTKLHSNFWSGVMGPIGLLGLFLADKMLAWIGETLGGGRTFKWFGVNERRLRIDVVYGDKNILGEAIGIGDNGNNGEFGVCNLLYSDILCYWKIRNPEQKLCSCNLNIVYNMTKNEKTKQLVWI